MISSFIIKNSNIVKPLLNNIGVGVSLSIFQILLCSSHYNELFINKDIILNNFLITTFTYGYDRFRDALSYEASKEKENYSIEKQTLYNAILKNEKFFQIYYNIIFFMSYIILSNHNLKEFTIPLFSTIFYKDLKEMLPFFKPIYISIMWILAGLILPIIWNDGYYDIIKYKDEIISNFLLFYTMTNLLDINDYKEDLYNKIYTIPVLLGINSSLILNNLILFISSILIIDNLNNFNIILLLTNWSFYFPIFLKILKENNQEK